MKIKSIIAAMVFLATPAQSEEMSPNIFCTFLGAWAESMMGARQAGASLDEILEVVDDTTEEPWKLILIEQAFKTPIGDTPEERKEISKHFGDMLKLQCLIHFAKKSK
ncbi:hypothetical protein D6827_01755 [Candidatus Parcubacteria bacterium]|nr:MAG: hypothetical protein D6827_01755 [Candidatus Parcubacteria bacterium]